MTEATGKFLRWAEDYYGPYAANGITKSEVAKRLDWLIGARDIRYVEILRRKILDGYSNRFKAPPDVATLNEFSRAATAEWYATMPTDRLLPEEERMPREEAAKKIAQLLAGLVERGRA